MHICIPYIYLCIFINILSLSPYHYFFAINLFVAHPLFPYLAISLSIFFFYKYSYICSVQKLYFRKQNADN